MSKQYVKDIQIPIKDKPNYKYHINIKYYGLIQTIKIYKEAIKVNNIFTKGTKIAESKTFYRFGFPLGALQKGLDITNNPDRLDFSVLRNDL